MTSPPHLPGSVRAEADIHGADRRVLNPQVSIHGHPGVAEVELEDAAPFQQALPVRLYPQALPVALGNHRGEDVDRQGVGNVV